MKLLSYPPTLIPSSTITLATYDATKHHFKNPITSLVSTSSINSTTSLMGAINSATTTTMTINSLTKQTQSQIPSYHGGVSNIGGGVGGGLEHYRQQQQRSNSFKHQYQRQYQQQQQQPQPSQLPHTLNQYNHSSNIKPTTNSITSSITTTTNNQGFNRTSGSNTGSGSSSATSSSPLSPPSVSYNINKDDSKLVNEMNKLYRKSPFMQKKLNGSSFNRYNASPGDESPKKESVLSSIGHSILRNLTTSPFSQKKNTNTSNVQSNQIDPLWHIPSTQDVSLDFDVCDTTITSTSAGLTAKLNNVASPALQRKRFQVSNDAKINTGSVKKTSVDTDKEDINKPSMIPLTKNEAQTQRVSGNHSPIVLQRFYHQQNQLREKELERQQHHTNMYNKHSPSDGTNPFHTNCYQTTSLSLSSSPHQHSSYIPVASTSTLSSYSTSSQSSTQSSQCSQIGVSVVGGESTSSTNQEGPRSLPLKLNDTNTTLPTSPATLGFGTTTTSPAHLQYQPLPQQYLKNPTTPFVSGSVIRTSRSPATSPDTLSESAVLNKTPQQITNNPRLINVTSPTVTKLSKLYNQRSGSASASLANANTASGVSKENNFKSESATSPTNGLTSANDNVVTEGGERKAQLYYRTMSCGSSSSGNSQATSPSTETCRGSIEGFQEGSSAAGFIRRYAATGGAGSNINNSGPSSSMPSTHTPVHILANLERRHRSPDPPPRYNRGQSPLLLRKNILELGGQPPGTSPMLNRRFVNASPPLPPPRRGSESVPGSPQHFRTRIHYTPEPQRRIYRTIDQ